LLVAAQHFCAENRISANHRCLQSFCAHYNQHRFEVVPEWAALAKPEISWQTLIRWQDELKKNGVKALMGKYGTRKNKNAVEGNPQLRELIEGMLLNQPHLGAKALYRYAQVRYTGAEPLPSLQIVQRWLKAYKENPETASRLAYATDPDRWRSKFEPALGSRSERVKALNDLWELDSTLADAVWELSNGKRYAIIGCIDVFSRRGRLLVNPTSNSDAIAALLRRCLLEWGVPKAIRTDNGKDYTSIYIQSVIGALEVDHELCTPFTPTEKPHIERFLGTFNHSFVEYLKGYVGHSVAERQSIRAREILKDAPEKAELKVVSLDATLAEFQKFCDQWIDWYLQQPHQGLGGKRPLEMLGAQKTVTINPRALDVLLQKAPGGDGKRIVQKKGVQVGRLEDGKTAWFIGDWIGNPGVIGSTVYVRLDACDLGTIYLYKDSLAKDYIGSAACAELVEMDRKVVAMKAKHRSKLVRTAVSERRRVAKKLAKQVEGFQGILDKSSAKLANVLVFPGSTQELRVSATESANVLLKDLEPKPPQPSLSEERRAELERISNQPKPMKRGVERFNDLRGIEPSEMEPDDYEFMQTWLNSPDSQHVLKTNIDFFPHLRVFLDAQRASG
jgi:transposase InsO family protein